MSGTGVGLALKAMKFSLHCCQFLGIAERLLWSGQIGKLCDGGQPEPNPQISRQSMYRVIACWRRVVGLLGAGLIRVALRTAHQGQWRHLSGR